MVPPHHYDGVVGEGRCVESIENSPELCVQEAHHSSVRSAQFVLLPIVDEKVVATGYVAHVHVWLDVCHSGDLRIIAPCSDGHALGGRAVLGEREGVVRVHLKVRLGGKPPKVRPLEARREEERLRLVGLSLGLVSQAVNASDDFVGDGAVGVTARRTIDVGVGDVQIWSHGAMRLQALHAFRGLHAARTIGPMLHGWTLEGAIVELIAEPIGFGPRKWFVSTAFRLGRASR
mmetsp:Transcript_41577/g.90167  ORF Transcript_41577/g.90167 Transcript_41577/m.90167 type:complete len:232 (-) Transcript_41577:271-966(-)